MRSASVRPLLILYFCSSVVDCTLRTQFADEIIRQVTVNCAERGLLLLRVRDELRMTIVAYQACFYRPFSACCPRLHGLWLVG